MSSWLCKWQCTPWKGLTQLGKWYSLYSEEREGRVEFFHPHPGHKSSLFLATSRFILSWRGFFLLISLSLSLLIVSVPQQLCLLTSASESFSLSHWWWIHECTSREEYLIIDCIWDHLQCEYEKKAANKSAREREMSKNHFDTKKVHVYFALMECKASEKETKVALSEWWHYPAANEQIVIAQAGRLLLTGLCLPWCIKELLSNVVVVVVTVAAFVFLLVE